MKYLAYAIILSMFGHGLAESSLNELEPVNTGTEKEASRNKI